MSARIYAVLTLHQPVFNLIFDLPGSQLNEVCPKVGNRIDFKIDNRSRILWGISVNDDPFLEFLPRKQPLIAYSWLTVYLHSERLTAVGYMNMKRVYCKHHVNICLFTLVDGFQRITAKLDSKRLANRAMSLRLNIYIFFRLHLVSIGGSWLIPYMGSENKYLPFSWSIEVFDEDERAKKVADKQTSN